MRSALRIGVVGGGPAGQAAAILLARQGHRLTLFEQTRSPGPVGAGILLQPTGMAVLDRLGARQRVESLGAPIERLFGTTNTGRMVMDLAYADLSPRARGIGVHRGMLFTTLQAMVHEAGVRIENGCRVAKLRGDLTSAPELVTDGGDQLGPFDLVVIADGARSALRDQLGVVKRAAPYPWGALWFVAEDPGCKYSGVLRQVYRSTTRMIGFLPTGRAHESGPETVSLFWSLPANTLASVHAAGLDAWKNDARQLTNEANPILDQVRSMDQLLYAGYVDAVVEPCFRGRVVCVGDAAHAMSPQLGQGANLALVDAAILTDSIGAHPEVMTGLELFESARRKHWQFYAWASRWLTPIFQSSDTWRAFPRDLLTGAACRIPWIRRQMLLSLAGVKTGLLRSDSIPFVDDLPVPDSSSEIRLPSAV